MSFKLERLQDMPALHLSFSDDVVFADIMLEMSDAVFNALEQETHPIYYIIDGQNLKMTFNDILNSVQYGTKTGHSNFKHRNIKQLIFVSNSKMIATV